MYEFISDEVRGYWNKAEEYLNDISESCTCNSVQIARMVEGTRHNLRMIISIVNLEETVRRIESGELPCYEYEEED